MPRPPPSYIFDGRRNFSFLGGPLLPLAAILIFNFYFFYFTRKLRSVNVALRRRLRLRLRVGPGRARVGTIPLSKAFEGWFRFLSCPSYTIVRLRAYYIYSSVSRVVSISNYEKEINLSPRIFFRRGYEQTGWKIDHDIRGLVLSHLCENEKRTEERSSNSQRKWLVLIFIPIGISFSTRR